jgi:hypothetical protein
MVVVGVVSWILEERPENDKAFATMDISSNSAALTPTLAGLMDGEAQATAGTIGIAKEATIPMWLVPRKMST